MYVAYLSNHPLGRSKSIYRAGLTLISLVPEVFWWSRRARIASLVINIISALLSTVVTAIDLAIIIVARSKLQSVLADVGASSLGFSFAILFGTAPWLSLVAVIFLWGAVVTGSIVVCSCCTGKDNLLDSTSSISQAEVAAAEAEIESELAPEIEAEIEARAEVRAEEIIEEREEEARERRWWKRRSRKRDHKRTERY
jgi:hypothetical protein